MMLLPEEFYQTLVTATNYVPQRLKFTYEKPE